MDKAKIDRSDKRRAIQSLTKVSQQNEKGFQVEEGGFDRLVKEENRMSYAYGGRTVDAWAQPPMDDKKTGQLSLF